MLSLWKGALFRPFSLEEWSTQSGEIIPGGEGNGALAQSIAAAAFPLMGREKFLQGPAHHLFALFLGGDNPQALTLCKAQSHKTDTPVNQIIAQRLAVLFIPAFQQLEYCRECFLLRCLAEQIFCCLLQKLPPQLLDAFFQHRQAVQSIGDVLFAILRAFFLGVFSQAKGAQILLQSKIMCQLS